MANLASSPRHSDSWHGAQLAAAELPTGVVSQQPPGGSIADGNTVRAVISNFPDEQLTTHVADAEMLPPAIYRKVRRFTSARQCRDHAPSFHTSASAAPYDAARLLDPTSEMLETGSSCTSVELMISGEVVSRISTATESRRRALKDTPSPSPSFRSWCSSIRVYWRVEPYMLTQAGPRVGRKPGGDCLKRVR